VTTWSATSLRPKYKRALIGFDFRLPIVPVLQALKLRNPSRLERQTKAATIDPELWQKADAQKYEAERNGVNLIGAPAKELYEGIVSTAAVMVALDIPATLFSHLAETFGLTNLDSDKVFWNPRWKHLGFDIADIRTQSSALYSFDLSDDEQDSLRKVVRFPLNDRGLLNQDSDAISACAHFDVVIPGHAPFAPCGVWACI
jgi:hypothetical protein